MIGKGPSSIAEKLNKKREEKKEAVKKKCRLMLLRRQMIGKASEDHKKNNTNAPPVPSEQMIDHHISNSNDPETINQCSERISESESPEGIDVALRTNGSGSIHEIVDSSPDTRGDGDGDDIYLESSDNGSIASDGEEINSIDEHNGDELNSLNELNAFTQECMNCHRRIIEGVQQSPINYLNIEMATIDVKNISFQRKFCLFRKSDTETDNVLVCTECKNVISKDTEKYLSPQLCWPAFIWSVLIDQKARALHGDELWSFVPTQWRSWWIDSTIQNWGNTSITLEHPEPFFAEVSLEKTELDIAIKELKWVNLVKNVDKYGSIPYVRCPWGCSEFYNETKHLPLDVVFSKYLEERHAQLFISPSCVRDRVISARTDYLSSHPILHNPSWICKPAIAFEENIGPVVLTCRFHGNGCRYKYLHVPRNPTGTIMTDASDQYAPAVPTPRTVHAAKARNYSNSFHLAEINGNYEGLDTLILANRGRFNINNEVADERDCLALAGRNDLQWHMKRMAQQNIIPDWVVNDRLIYSSRRFPEEVVQAVRTDFCYGGTFVTLEDAMELESSLRNNRGSVIAITREEENGISTNRVCHFIPSWPNAIVWVHPFDSYGAKFPYVPSTARGSNETFDSRIVWALSSLAVTVPPLWKILAKNVTNNEDWYGWLLAYATRRCLVTKSVGAGRNNPFRKVMNEKALHQKCFKAWDDGMYEPKMVKTAFAALQDDIYVLDYSEQGLFNWVEITQDVVVVYQSWESSERQLLRNEQGSKETKSWELRCVLTASATIDGKWSGKLYSRHGTPNFPSWWVQRCGWKESQHHGPNLPGKLLKEWDIAVYVNTSRTNMERLKENYLLACGGQVHARCKDHDVPLIVAPCSTKVACLSCDKPSQYVCPIQTCSMGICKVHYNRQYFLPHQQSTVPPPSVEVEAEDDSSIVLPTDDVGSWASDDMSEDDNSIDLDGVINAVETNFDHFGGNAGASVANTHRCSNEEERIGNFLTPDDFEHVEQDLIDSTRTSYLHQQVDTQISSSTNSSSTFPFHYNDGEHKSWLGDSMSDDDSLDSFASEAHLFETDLITSSMLDHEICDNSSGEEEGDDNRSASSGGHFPTSNAGRKSFLFQTDVPFIGAHVIFNKHARLLIRAKDKLRPNKSQQYFLQRLVATTDDTTIPLVYPEAMIFPSIFWNACSDGSMLGAMPSALLSDNATLRRLGFATIQDHYRTRIMDTSLLTSTDNRYHFFAFDACVNLGMRGQDTRIILSRGFSQQQGAGGVRLGDSEQLLFDADSIDSRPNVNKLAAALGEDMATFFFTHTCSMKTHFGMRVIKKWLDSNEAIEIICREIVTNDINSNVRAERIRKELVQSSCVLAMRCWINVINIYMAYITSSPEKPIGTVRKSWYRLEFQDAEANMPHIHSILWLAENDGTEKGLEQVLHHVRASISSMVTPDEEQGYIDAGIVSSKDELVHILEDLRKMLLHRHSRRCLIPNFRKTTISTTTSIREVGANGNKILTDALHTTHKCKVPDNRLLSPNPTGHCFVETELCHTKAALDVLKVLELVRGLPGGEIEYVDQSLTAKRHIPPTSAEDGIISPVLVPLALMNPNSNNVQYLDTFGVLRYLAKYAAGVDECNRVYIRAPSYRKTEYTIDVEAVGNTKITSVAMEEAKKRKKDKRHHRGRLVSQPEILMLLLNIAQIYTNIEFVHISTVPLEERPAFDRVAPITKFQQHGWFASNGRNITDIDTHAVIPSHAARTNKSRWPHWRRFKESALIIAADQMVCPLSIDTVTIFGLRPPELLFIKEQALYFRCFKRFDIESKKGDRFDKLMQFCRDNLHREYMKCSWIDATSKLVKLRYAAIPTLLDYAKNASPDDFGGPRNKESVLAMFSNLSRYHSLEDSHTGIRSADSRRRWEELKERFLCAFDQPFLPVVWYTNIKPIHSNRFLIHILLSMGSFDNEMDLMSTGDIKNAFIHARLYDPSKPEESVKDITRRYILTQLKNQPGGTRQFDRFCVAAYNVINNALLNDQIVTDGLPPFLYSHLKRMTNETIDEKLHESFRHIAEVVVKQASDAGFDNLPSVNDLLNARSAKPNNLWDCRTVAKGKHQPDASYLEQQIALETGTNAITKYMDINSDVCPKCLAIVGDPGAGKTTVLNLLVLHAMAAGLNVAMTAQLSERALQLGGRHLHWLFAIPVRNNTTPGHLADLAIVTLYKLPARIEYLRRIDVLAIDELGQISAEILGVVDIILRRIRCCSRFMGGVLLICSMDVLQLLPIRGRPPMLSPHMLTSFRFARLKHSVRAADDPIWQRIQKITRLLPTELSPQIIMEFQNLVRENCTFVKSFEDSKIPKSALFVFGKKEARSDAEKRTIEKMKQSGEYSFSKAIDEEATKDGDWKQASDLTTLKLNRDCKEPETLFFFKGACYEITFNQHDSFSQSQLAILLTVPSQEHLGKLLPIDVMVAPPGVKRIPREGVKREELLQQGWNDRKVGIAPEHSQLIASELRARRRQYGLRHRIASTIHATMGQEVTSLVTKVSDTDPAYTLWERAQVVVLLSRTRKACETIFVGSSQETVRVLTNTLLRVTQFTTYLCNLLNVFTQDTSQPSGIDPIPYRIVQQNKHPFRPKDIPLPSDNTGCCYVLVSCKQPNVTYIGETINLSRRIDEHNSGFGSDQTQSAFLRPWAILGYVVGFQGSRSKRKAFESQWKAMRQNELERCPVENSGDWVALLALSVIHYRKATDKTEDLIFVYAGWGEVPQHEQYTRDDVQNKSSMAGAEPLQAVPKLQNIPSATRKRQNGNNLVRAGDNGSGKRLRPSFHALPSTSTLYEHTNTLAAATGSNINAQQINPSGGNLIREDANVGHQQSSFALGGFVDMSNDDEENDATPQKLTLAEVQQLCSLPVLPAHLEQRYGYTPLYSGQYGKIYHRDLHSLLPGGWLNDEVVMYFMIKRLHHLKRHVDVFDSLLFHSFLDQNITTGDPFPDNMESLIQRVFRRDGEEELSPFTKRMWIVPLNVHGNHWELLVLIDPTQPCRKFLLFDSLKNTSSTPMGSPQIHAFVTYILNTAQRYYEPRAPAFSEVDLLDSWVDVIATRQPNYCDCGVFTILFSMHSVSILEEDAVLDNSTVFDATGWFSPAAAVAYRRLLRQEIMNDIIAYAES